MVAEIPTAPAAATEAQNEDNLDEARKGVDTTAAGEPEHEGPRDRPLWQLLEFPGRQLEQGLSLLTLAHRLHFAPLLHWQQRREVVEACMVTLIPEPAPYSNTCCN